MYCLLKTVLQGVNNKGRNSVRAGGRASEQVTYYDLKQNNQTRETTEELQPVNAFITIMRALPSKHADFRAGVADKLS